MLEANTLVAVFAAAIVLTLLLLAIGLAIGYRLGLHGSEPVIPAAPERQVMTAREHELYERLQLCREMCVAVFERNATLSRLLDDHRSEIPAEFELAVNRLVEATTTLTSQLRTEAIVTPLKLCDSASPAPLSREPTAEQEPDPRPARVAVPSMASTRAMLTAEELVRLTSDGGLPATSTEQSKRRYLFNYEGRVFPCSPSDTPDVSRAVTVRFHDISVQGISFFWPGDPDFERAVIALGTEEWPLFMVAEVSCAKTVYMHGALRTLVGCQFIGRPNRPFETMAQPAANLRCQRASELESTAKA